MKGTGGVIKLHLPGLNSQGRTRCGQRRDRGAMVTTNLSQCSCDKCLWLAHFDKQREGTQ